MDNEHTFEFRWEVRVQFVRVLVDMNGMPLGHEKEMGVYNFPATDNPGECHQLWDSIIRPHAVIEVKGGCVIDESSSHPNQIFTVVDQDVEDGG